MSTAMRQMATPSMITFIKNNIDHNHNIGYWKMYVLTIIFIKLPQHHMNILLFILIILYILWNIKYSSIIKSHELSSDSLIQIVCRFVNIKSLDVRFQERVLKRMVGKSYFLSAVIRLKILARIVRITCSMIMELTKSDPFNFGTLIALWKTYHDITYMYIFKTTTCY